VKNILFYSTQDYEKDIISKIDIEGYKFYYTSKKLDQYSCVLSKNYQCVVILSKDVVNKKIICLLKSYGVNLICTRSTGYDNIDLAAASLANIAIANVPSYSPESIAEHSVMLMLSLCKHLKKSLQNTKKFNFDINDLISKNIGELTIGIVGAGNIGMASISMLKGFGARIIAYDIDPNYNNAKKQNFQYCSFNELICTADIISIYLPLNPKTEYIINQQSIEKMKDGVLIVNVSRGKLIDTKAALNAIQSGRIAGLGIDVYENENKYFFSDHSANGISDDILKQLIAHPKVILTGHQAFLTETSIKERIRITTLNIQGYFNKKQTNNFLNWNDEVDLKPLIKNN